MWGFGEPTPGNSPTDFPEGTAIANTIDSTGFSWGFGDIPQDLSLYLDWGFGDPPVFAVSPALLVFEPTTLPDEGGVIIDIVAAYDDFGPYRVRLRETGTNKIFPELSNPPGQFCNSGIPGMGIGCVPELKPPIPGDPQVPQVGPKMSFVVPPLPPGQYDIEVFKAFDPGDTHTLVGALKIEWRQRDLHTYRIRKRLSNVLDAHIRSITFEKLLGLPEDET